MTVYIHIHSPSNQPVGKGGTEGEIEGGGKGKGKKIPLAEYAYQVKLTSEHTAYVSSPKIDKISLTVPVDDKDLKNVVREALIQSVKDPTVPHFKNAKVQSSSGVKYSISVNLTPPGSSERVLIQVDPEATKKYPNPSFMRLEFNPDRLGPERLSFFKQQLAEVSYQQLTYAQVVGSARITRVDIACDLANVPTAGVICRYHKPAKWHVYFAPDGNVESIYMGVKSGGGPADALVYDKRQEQLDKKRLLDFWGLEHMRVEIISRKRPFLKNLGALDSPFHLVDLFFPRVVQPPDEAHTWETFLDSCRQRGVEGALDLLPQNIRPLYAERLEESKVLIWRPEKIWAKWNVTVESSGLLTL